MQIPRKLIDDYTATLNAFSEDAKARLAEMLEMVDYSDISTAREAIIEAFETVASEYSAYVGYAAEDFYFAIREIELGEMGAAYSTYSRNSAATDGAIRAFMQEAVDGNVDKVPGLVLQRMDYELAKFAAETVLSMGRKEKRRVRYARVPSGSETCKFCLMLASRGFVYHSEESAGINHYHPNCDCRIVPNFNMKKYGIDGNVEGYDRKKLYDDWVNSGFRPNSKSSGTKGNFSLSSNSIASYLSDAKDVDDLNERANIVKSRIDAMDDGDRNKRQFLQLARGVGLRRMDELKV